MGQRSSQEIPVPLKKNGEGYTLFFAPEAGVTSHFAALCIVARTLKELGHPVLFLRCFEGFSRCPVMEMKRVPWDGPPADKEDCCLSCVQDSFAMLEEYGLTSIDLRALWRPSLGKRLEQALADAPEDLRDFQFDSVCFGQLAALDLVLAHKISNFNNVEPRIRTAWLQYIANSVRAYLLTEECCRRYPVRRLAYFNDYSLLLGARLAAVKHRLPAFSVTLASHRNIDRRRLVIHSQVGSVASWQHAADWPRWRNLPLSREEVQEIGEDVLFRMKSGGSHIFSPAKTFHEKDLLARLGFHADQKLLVAFTSSLDEMLAGQALRAGLGSNPPAPAQPFADQIEWLQELVQWVKSRDDFQLAVRVHPREGKGFESQHLRELRKRFSQNLPSCRFFWPEDPVSSYDLGEIADGALISWSTIGLELARLGVPVLACTHGWPTLPGDDVLESASSRAEYFRKLDVLADKSLTLEAVIAAFRWYHFFHLGISLDLSDVVPSSDYNGLPSFRLPKEAKNIATIFMRGQEIAEVNVARMEANQHPDRQEEETQAIREQLRRFIRFFFTGEDSATDHRLALVDAEELPSHEAWRHDASLLVRERRLSHFVENGKSWTRYSPLCRRLGPLCK